MEFEYTLSLGLSNQKQKHHLKEALKPIACNLEDYDREDFIDEVSDFIENEELGMFCTLYFPECDEEYYTDLITDCLVLLAKAIPEYSFGAQFVVINCSSDGDRLVEYNYDSKNLIVNILDTDSAMIFECEACGEELEEIIELSAHDIGTTYTCPGCGTELNFGNEKLTNVVIDTETYVVERDDDDDWEEGGEEDEE
ncbi:MAG: hypothetical protein II320_03555 [Oscillospiraceae bacterium]|nr:hypothetical protein [Oscillospiraceae bacterium]